MNHKKKEEKADKAEKSAFKAAAKGTPGATPIIPGFAKATLSKLADGTWQALLTCINGDPRRNTSTTLPSAIKFYGGGAIEDRSEVALYLPDGANVDVNYIFPWNNGDSDPLRAGGGVVTGGILEGSQRRDPKPTDPILAPFLTSDWVNGTPYTLTVEVPASFGVTFYPGEHAFGLYIIDAVAGVKVLKAVAKSEGTCLDLPPA